MSTFDGFVEEFPDISIDYFRQKPGRTPPLVCFLSHVHSDHLVGLDKHRSSRIFCSPMTRALLLSYEPRMSRLNFSRGILETRHRPYDSRELKALLKSLPLNTPSDIEVKPYVQVRVTLLDANHCPGAVMFLIQGTHRTILYTGDIRAEPWWVDGLTRNPVMIPYTRGSNVVDKVYLDTTFASPQQKCFAFPEKAHGIAELLEKLQRYSPETIFTLPEWTLGYEDVWLAVSYALGTQVHVDEYKFNRFRSSHTQQTSGGLNTIHEFAALTGCKVGNTHQPGSLTVDPRATRLHACSPDLDCPALIAGNVIQISPVLGYTETGEMIQEPAIGSEAQLTSAVHQKLKSSIANACSEGMLSDQLDDETFQSLLDEMPIARSIGIRSPLRTHSDTAAKHIDGPFVQVNAQSMSRSQDWRNVIIGEWRDSLDSLDYGKKLHGERVSRINFPYSRHSSYKELCHFLKTLQPRDVFPCTFQMSDWSDENSIRGLFGECCSDDFFSYDNMLQRRRKETQENIMQKHLATPLKAAHASDVNRDIMPRGTKRKLLPRQISMNAAADAETITKRHKSEDAAHDIALNNGSHNSFETIKSMVSKIPIKSIEATVSQSHSKSQNCQPSCPPFYGEGNPNSNSVAQPIENSGKGLTHPIFDDHIKGISRRLSLPPKGTQSVPNDISDCRGDYDTIERALNQSEVASPMIPTFVDLDGAKMTESEHGNDDENDQGTQITLSDAAFESQDMDSSNGTKADSRTRRKEAYTRARKALRSPIESGQLGLISTRGKHRDDDQVI